MKRSFAGRRAIECKQEATQHSMEYEAMREQQQQHELIIAVQQAALDQIESDRIVCRRIAEEAAEEIDAMASCDHQIIAIAIANGHLSADVMTPTQISLQDPSQSGLWQMTQQAVQAAAAPELEAQAAEMAAIRASAAQERTLRAASEAFVREAATQEHQTMQAVRAAAATEVEAQIAEVAAVQASAAEERTLRAADEAAVHEAATQEQQTLAAVNEMAMGHVADEARKQVRHAEAMQEATLSATAEERTRLMGEVAAVRRMAADEVEEESAGQQAMQQLAQEESTVRTELERATRAHLAAETAAAQAEQVQVLLDTATQAAAVLEANATEIEIEGSRQAIEVSERKRELEQAALRFAGHEVAAKAQQAEALHDAIREAAAPEVSRQMAERNAEEETQKARHSRELAAGEPIA